MTADMWDCDECGGATGGRGEVSDYGRWLCRQCHFKEDDWYEQMPDKYECPRCGTKTPFRWAGDVHDDDSDIVVCYGCTEVFTPGCPPKERALCTEGEGLNLSRDEWREIGEQSRRVWRELRELLDLCHQTLPKSAWEPQWHYTKAGLTRFRADLEEHMVDQHPEWPNEDGGQEFRDVFYGGDPDE